MGFLSKVPESVAFPVIVYGGIGLAVLLVIGVIYGIVRLAQ